MDRELPVAAWYPDPGEPKQIRYWDGQTWTGYVAPISGVADPVEGHVDSEKPFGGPRLGLLSAKSSHRHETEESTVPTLDTPRLGAAWHVTEEFSLGADGLKVEHLIIGSPGVFVLTTKDHSDEDVWVAERSFLVDGAKTDYLRSARQTVREVSEALTAGCGFEVAAEAMIVVKARELKIKAQPLDAHVVAFNLVGRWFSRQEPVLAPETVRAVFDFTSSAANWTAPTDSLAGRSL